VGALGHSLRQAGHRASASGGAAALDVIAKRSMPSRERPPSSAYARPASGYGAPRSFTPAIASGFAEAMQAPLDAMDQPSAQGFDQSTTAATDLLDHPLGAARCQIHETYIIAQTRNSMIIVDQHAAHERLVYERMKAMLADGGVARQGLLIPEIVEVGEDEAEALTERADELAELGLVLERFGPGAVAVRETPGL